AKHNKRQQLLRDFQQLNTTVILYESVHRINYLLEDLLDLLPNSNIVVAKELTKQFENFVLGSVQQVYDYFQANQDTL
ncbi:SAM-dependent methyltransferase, partial [Francisella tularensis]|uniref:SAM-dependent methyltransferase n=1 Tax=Francisella tularensis TaxID=263 RepID=UPI0023AE4642|nr:16S rRNA (cytidine(1402)-2'-O)-methyltransferase [Francisella tularensis subsp. holarctica]